MGRAELLEVQVVYCAGPGLVDAVDLLLPAGSTLAQALSASGILQRHGVAAQAARVGVWGKVQELGTLLRDRDRLELYRPLVVDPKEARRQRYSKHKQAVASRKAR